MKALLAKTSQNKFLNLSTFLGESVFHEVGHFLGCASGQNRFTVWHITAIGTRRLLNPHVEIAPTQKRGKLYSCDDEQQVLEKLTIYKAGKTMECFISTNGLMESDLGDRLMTLKIYKDMRMLFKSDTQYLEYLKLFKEKIPEHTEKVLQQFPFETVVQLAKLLASNLFIGVNDCDKITESLRNGKPLPNISANWNERKEQTARKFVNSFFNEQAWSARILKILLTPVSWIPRCLFGTRCFKNGD